MDNRVEVILFRKNKQYKLVPEINDGCTGCALKGNCNNVPKFKQCYSICAHLKGVWKEIKDEKAVTPCNQLVARKALEVSVKFGNDIDNMLGSNESTVLSCLHERSLAASIVFAAERALVEPPRNCDAFSKEEVLKMLDSRSFSKEDTIEWLYATKGVEV